MINQEHGEYLLNIAKKAVKTYLETGEQILVPEDCPEELKQVSNEIVDVCGGLPLATISIASLLANQPSVSVDLLTHSPDRKSVV